MRHAPLCRTVTRMVAWVVSPGDHELGLEIVRGDQRRDLTDPGNSCSLGPSTSSARSSSISDPLAHLGHEPVRDVPCSVVDM
jgi:hypothetical protein